MEWVARIMAAALMMVLPGLLGQWLDEKFGFELLALIGFALGIALGMYYLIVQTRQADARRKATQTPRKNGAGTKSNSDSTDHPGAP